MAVKMAAQEIKLNEVVYDIIRKSGYWGENPSFPYNHYPLSVLEADLGKMGISYSFHELREAINQDSRLSFFIADPILSQADRKSREYTVYILAHRN